MVLATEQETDMWFKSIQNHFSWIERSRSEAADSARRFAIASARDRSRRIRTIGKRRSSARYSRPQRGASSRRGAISRKWRARAS